MTTEQQNKVWASLPDDFKEVLSLDYREALEAFKLDPRNVHIETHIRFLINYFGESNVADPNNKPKREPDIHVKDGDAECKVWNGDDNYISLKAHIEADKPTPKFKVGDRVVTTKPCGYYGTGWTGTIKTLCTDTASVKFDRSGTYSVPYQDLAPYAEPTATKGEEKEHNVSETVKDSVDWMRKLDKAVEEYKTAFSEIISDDWQHYRRELAAKIAVATITATQSFDVERVMAMTDGIIERLKNSKV